MKGLVALLILSSPVYAGCPIDTSDYSGPNRTLQGAPGPIKLYHCKAKHQCQSKENIGYTCDVELRDATDPNNGQMRLRFQNCCKFYNGKPQTDGRSINFTPESCSPLF